jgi:hypothetical protein
LLLFSRECVAGEDPDIHEAKVATVRFYTDKILLKANSLKLLIWVIWASFGATRVRGNKQTGDFTYIF